MSSEMPRCWRRGGAAETIGTSVRWRTESSPLSCYYLTMIEREKKTGEMSDWSGHERDTSALLLDVLTTATSGSAKISRADQVLFTACEFWAAARNGSLTEQLRGAPLARLRAAETAFTVIGLTKATRVLHHGRMALTENASPATLRNVVEFIETSLAELDEPVDLIIADYANHQALDRESKRK